MAVELSWHEEGRVVYQRFCGVLAPDDVQEAARMLKQGVANGMSPVHTIVDIRQVTDFPVSIGQINSLKPDSAVMGWMVVIGLHPAVRFFARVMSLLRGIQYHPVSTLEDALTFLARHDAALGHLAP